MNKRPERKALPLNTLPCPEYLRPQLRRPDWTNLNGEWAFAFDDEDVGLTRSWQGVSAEDLASGGSPFDRVITVPFCHQSRLSGIGDTGVHDVIWYARPFEHALADDEEPLLLGFGTVDYGARPLRPAAQVRPHPHKGDHRRKEASGAAPT